MLMVYFKEEESKRIRVHPKMKGDSVSSSWALGWELFSPSYDW